MLLASQKIRWARNCRYPPQPYHAEYMHDVFSYDVVVDAIRLLLSRGHVDLVETLAERIADALLAYPRVYRVIARVEKLDVIGVFATAATARSRVYEIEIDKRRDDLAVFTVACSGLADMIEGAAPRARIRELIASYAQALRTRIGRWPDRAILGCTHYEIVADLFREVLPEGTELIGQPAPVAAALADYVRRHPEYATGRGGGRRFLTTGDPGAQPPLAEAFWGGPLAFEAVQGF